MVEGQEGTTQNPWDRPSSILDRVEQQSGPEARYNALVEELNKDYTKARNETNNIWDYRNTVYMTTAEIKRRGMEDELALGWLKNNMSRYDKNGDGLTLAEIQQGLEQANSNIHESGLNWRLDRMFLTSISNKYEQLKRQYPDQVVNGIERKDAITLRDVNEALKKAPGTPPERETGPGMTDQQLSGKAKHLINILDSGNRSEALDFILESRKLAKNATQFSQFLKEAERYENRSGGKGKGLDLSIKYGNNGEVLGYDLIANALRKPSPIPDMPHVTETQIKNVEEQVAQDSQMKVRPGDSYWTLAARHLGVQPKDSSRASEIHHEMVRLRLINNDVSLHPGDVIATLYDTELRAAAIEKIRKAQKTTWT